MMMGGILIFFAKDRNSHLESKSIQKPCFYVQASGLNLREKPTIEADIQGRLEYNAKICEYSKMENGFLKISGGWVFAEYLSLNPPLPKKPILTPQKETMTKISQETLPQAKLPQEKAKNYSCKSPQRSKRGLVGSGKRIFSQRKLSSCQNSCIKSKPRESTESRELGSFCKGIVFGG